MKFRVIYMIEKISENGDLEFRRYAANKKTAETIRKRDGGDIMQVMKRDHDYIDPAWVERI